MSLVLIYDLITSISFVYIYKRSALVNAGDRMHVYSCLCGCFRMYKYSKLSYSVKRSEVKVSTR